MRHVKPSKKLTGEQIVEAAALHAGGAPFTQLCGRYNISNQSLGRLLKRRGFPTTSTQDTNSRTNSRRKYPCNDRFFSSFCDEARAYWAGFITADGCVMARKDCKNSKLLKISLAVVDRGHLEKFKVCLRAENPIHFEMPSGTIGKHAIRSDGRVKITISSNKLCDDLINNGIGPRKTSREKIPDAIPKEHVRHFIRGYLDGDGWWSLGHLPGWEAAGFCGGYNILSQIRQWISDNIPEAGRPNIIKVPGMYKISYMGGRQTRAIIACLYKDCTIALDRKVAVATAILQRHSKGPNRKRLRLTIGGEVRTLEEWAKLTGVSYTTAYARLRRGISPELAIRPTEGRLIRRRGQKLV
jgi:hypothetical protein